MHEPWRRGLPPPPFPTLGAVVMLKHSSPWEDLGAYSFYPVVVNIVSSPASAHGEQTVADDCPVRVKEQSFANVQGS